MAQWFRVAAWNWQWHSNRDSTGCSTGCRGIFKKFAEGFSKSSKRFKKIQKDSKRLKKSNLWNTWFAPSYHKLIQKVLKSWTVRKVQKRLKKVQNGWDVKVSSVVSGVQYRASDSVVQMHTPARHTLILSGGTSYIHEREKEKSHNCINESPHISCTWWGIFPFMSQITTKPNSYKS